MEVLDTSRSRSRQGERWCFLCSARLQDRARACEHGTATAVDGDGSLVLVRAWCQIFNLSRRGGRSLSWLEKLLRGPETEAGTGTGHRASSSSPSSSVCGSCSQAMEEVKACWIQQNELYSRIGRLLAKIESALKTETEMEDDDDDENGQDQDQGQRVELKGRRFKLLKAMQTAERFEVDQEALKLSVAQGQGQGQGQGFDEADEAVDIDLDIKMELIDTDPESNPNHDHVNNNNDDNDPEWASPPSPSPSSPATPDSTSTVLARARPLSPTPTPTPITITNLIDEIRNGLRQVCIPLKPVRWNEQELRWIVPRFRNQEPGGYNPSWLQAKQKTLARRGAKPRAVPPTSPSLRIPPLRLPYRCRQSPMGCSRTFTTAQRRENHELRVHQHPGDPFPFKCKMMDTDEFEECGRAFESRKNLASHQKKRHCSPGGRRVRVYCDHEGCNKMLISEERLVRHKANVHGEGEGIEPRPLEQHLCPECGKVFHSRDGMRSHVAKFHSHSANPRPLHRCEECSPPRSFGKKDDFERHQYKFHRTAQELASKPGHSCRLCGKVFLDKHYVKRHEILIHGTANPGLTPLLACSFANANAKTDGCACAFRCFGKHRLKLHERSHADVRSFRCLVEGCGATYKHERQLTEHGWRHTGERPFKCTHPGCGSAFFANDRLNNHVSVLHGNGSKLQCDLCGEQFPIRKYLARHMEKHRTGKIPIPTTTTTTVA